MKEFIQPDKVFLSDEKSVRANCGVFGIFNHPKSAIMAYYGLPQNPPPTQTGEEILSQENQAVTQQAGLEAAQRPDPWDVADNLLELGIALAGLLGGVFGSKALAALNLAKQKSDALREIITGNELFKKQNPQTVEAFKSSQQGQSSTTRTLVTELK